MTLPSHVLLASLPVLALLPAGAAGGAPALASEAGQADTVDFTRHWAGCAAIGIFLAGYALLSIGSAAGVWAIALGYAACIVTHLALNRHMV